AEVCPAEVCIIEACPHEVYPLKICPAEVCFTEVCKCDVCLPKAYTMKICSAEFCPAEVYNVLRMLYSPRIPYTHALSKNLELLHVSHSAHLACVSYLGMPHYNNIIRCQNRDAL